MKTSYHTHTKRCKHGKGNVNDFVNFAIANNFEVIGFTDHVPFKDNRMDFCRMFYSELDEYISEINEAKKANPNITIYSGFEAEYFEDSLEYYKELLTKVDYLVLGQHAIKKDDKYIFIDNCQSEEEFNMYVDAIEKAKNDKREVKKEFMSPYTVKKKYGFFNLKIVFVAVGIISLLLGSYFIFGNILGSDFSDSDITYVIRR